jgi:hypothetical protein
MFANESEKMSGIFCGWVFCPFHFYRDKFSIMFNYEVYFSPVFCPEMAEGAFSEIFQSFPEFYADPLFKYISGTGQDLLGTYLQSCGRISDTYVEIVELRCGEPMNMSSSI